MTIIGFINRNPYLTHKPGRNFWTADANDGTNTADWWLPSGLFSAAALDLLSAIHCATLSES